MDYSIPLNSIKEGKNDYSFEIKGAFFKNFSYSDIKGGDLVAEVNLEKSPGGFSCGISITGKVKIPCDKCLEEYFEPIECKETLFFEFGDKTEEISSKLIRLCRTEVYLDLSTYFFEFIFLSLPFQKFHPFDEEGNSLCNPEMLEKIEELTNKKKKQIDPRWEKLRNL